MRKLTFKRPLTERELLMQKVDRYIAEQNARLGPIPKEYPHDWTQPQFFITEARAEAPQPRRTRRAKATCKGKAVGQGVPA